MADGSPAWAPNGSAERPALGAGGDVTAEGPGGGGGMSRRRSALVAILVGAVCAYAAVRLLIGPPRPVLTDVVQGAVVGVGLAIVTVEVLARVKAIKVNGWITMLGCGVPSNGPLMRAACTGMFPGPGQRAGGGHLLDNAGRPCGSAADRPRRLRHALPGRWACTQRSVLVADPRGLPEPVRPESAWSTSPSREPHQWALNPTGCRRPRTGSGSGCGSTGPAGSSSTAGIPSGHCSRGKRAVRKR